MLLGEDAERLYLYKPAGIPVFPPHKDPAGDCLLARLLALHPERAEGWPPGFEGGLAHRLDTATSGLMIAARTPTHLTGVREDFRSGRLRKFYRFRSLEAVGFAERVVEVPIAHHPRRADRMVTQRPHGRTSHRGKWYPAWTRFRQVRGHWWEAEIRTGVMHQVRVHALHAGIPLVADPLYSGPDGPDTGYCLHALRVEAPGWSSPEAPLPSDVAELP